MTRVTVIAAPDHLDRFIGTPRAGLLELIWNALDADATEVHVDLDTSGLGGVLSLVVNDNGEGISADNAEIYFGALGGSWKKLGGTTTAGRTLHGRLGGGRFAAYGLGREVVWTSVSDATTGRKQTVIRGSRSTAQEFDIVSDESAANVGTRVQIADLTDAALKYVELDRVPDDLTAALAVYLLKYHPKIYWREKLLDPAPLIADRTETSAEVAHDGSTISVPVTIIEWTAPFDRALYLCNAEGVALHEVRTGIQAPGHHFTAYARWDGFSDRMHDLVLEGASAEPVPTIIDAVQDALRRHFKRRREERYTRVIESWKTEKSYPFDGEPKAGEKVDQATRDLFDLVAIAALPAVEKVDPASRKFSLRLLKEAIENSPDTVHTIMQEVLNLTDQDAEELKQLIEKTSLSGLISSAKTITDRLEFLASLEAIVNERDLKKVVKERSQLHRILANETWVFREEYALVGDDQTLRTVLRNNLALLGGEVVTVEDVETAEVVDEKGKSRVIDLMLSKVITQRQEHREHIVIELKRPSVHIGTDELAQIENYAMTVANDTRFAGTDTRWEFWIIGDQLTPAVAMRAQQTGREPGVTLQTDTPLNMVVRALPWAHIIRNAKHRLQFVKESLDYDPSTEAGLDYLRTRHAQYLPTIVLNASAVAGSEAREPVTEEPGSE